MIFKHDKRRIDIEVLDRDAIFPHDVAALVKLTDAGYRELMDRLLGLKPGQEIVLGASKAQDGVAFKRSAPDKVVGGKE